MDTSSPQFLTVIVAICGLLSGVVSASAVLLTVWINKRSEDRRNFRQLMVNAAVEDWKQQMEAYKVHQRSIQIIPLDIYIIRMIQFADLIYNEKLSNEDIIFKLREIDELTSKLTEYKIEMTRNISRRD